MRSALPKVGGEYTWAWFAQSGGRSYNMGLDADFSHWMSRPDPPKEDEAVMKDILLYNTMMRTKSIFEPLRLPVRMYVCGPTVYDVPHLGNARPAVVFDVLFRVLRHIYGAGSVIYARNYTDIDDKIIKRAAELNVPIHELTNSTIEQYESIVRDLSVLPPTLTPRATENIDAMIEMIRTLVEKDHAYVAEGHVLFEVASYGHGRLSRHSRDDLRESGRVEHAPFKKDVADFVLWKPSDSSQPGWDSPWGRGRPGWHIECSAMIDHHLGGYPPTIDIHGGGLDLVFPHHENEISQSECVHGKRLAAYWVHNGMMLVNGRKMAKSEGNFVTVPDVLQRHPGEVLRLFMLMTHYRQPIDYTEDRLYEARTVLDRFYRALEAVWRFEAEPQHPTRLWEALRDDLNTPEALTVLHEMATEAMKSPSAASKAEMLGAGKLLGLFSMSPNDYFRGKLPSDDIQTLIDRRERYRRERKFKEADAIREQLHNDGILLEDSPEGTQWRRIGP